MISSTSVRPESERCCSLFVDGFLLLGRPGHDRQTDDNKQQTTDCFLQSAHLTWTTACEPLAGMRTDSCLRAVDVRAHLDERDCWSRRRASRLEGQRADRALAADSLCVLGRPSSGDGDTSAIILHAVNAAVASSRASGTSPASTFTSCSTCGSNCKLHRDTSRYPRRRC